MVRKCRVGGNEGDITLKQGGAPVSVNFKDQLSFVQLQSEMMGQFDRGGSLIVKLFAENDSPHGEVLCFELAGVASGWITLYPFSVLRYLGP